MDVRQLEALHTQCYSWALTCVGGRRSDAEDLLQSSYLQILEGRARFRGESSLRTFVFGVIRLQARSRWRLAKRSLQQLARLASLQPGDATLGETSCDADHDLDRTTRAASVLAALESLPRRQRQVLDLVIYRELTIADAAQVLGIGLGSARQHYERAKARLRRELEADDTEPK